MVNGKLVHFHMLSISIWLVCSVVIVLLQSDKITALLYQLTTVKIKSYLFDSGRSMMKSIVMVSQIPYSTSFGFNDTLIGGLILVVWHVAHPLIYAFMNVVIPGH
jgi:hypothetical protein